LTEDRGFKALGQRRVTARKIQRKKNTEHNGDKKFFNHMSREGERALGPTTILPYTPANERRGLQIKVCRKEKRKA